LLWIVGKIICKFIFWRHIITAVYIWLSTVIITIYISYCTIIVVLLNRCNNLCNVIRSLCQNFSLNNGTCHKYINKYGRQAPWWYIFTRYNIIYAFYIPHIIEKYRTYVYIYIFMNLIFIYFFSYPAKNFCEHGTAKHPRRSDVYVLVHGRMRFTVRLGKAIMHIIIMNRYPEITIYKLLLYIYIIMWYHFSYNMIISKRGLDLNIMTQSRHIVPAHIIYNNIL